MKRIFIAFLLLFTAVAVNAQDKAKGAEITFKEKSHEFGDITQGDKVEYIFTFTNTGTEPLILSEVVTTCGCTAPEWNREPVMPGKTGQIHITFNSANKSGRQNKVITILSNAINNPERVSILCNVLLPKAD